MRLATVTLNKQPAQTAIFYQASFFFISDLNAVYKTSWPTELLSLIQEQQLKPMQKWFDENKSTFDLKPGLAKYRESEICYKPLYTNPGKIWGIGLNYSDHAADLSEKAPQGIPASFIKGSTTLVGPGDTIRLPELSEKVTGEAELGIIIGQDCKDVKKENWLDVVAGFTCIIDMTAEDILRQNPRYLTLSKNFDTFFSFGPQLITVDEIDDLNNLRVCTLLNGQIEATNQIKNMTFDPALLVHFHSQVMSLKAGDIISSGTPGAAVLSDADRIECRISGFEPLVNPVVDLKRS